MKDCYGFPGSNVCFVDIGLPGPCVRGRCGIGRPSRHPRSDHRKDQRGEYAGCSGASVATTINGNRIAEFNETAKQSFAGEFAGTSSDDKTFTIYVKGGQDLARFAESPRSTQRKPRALGEADLPEQPLLVLKVDKSYAEIGRVGNALMRNPKLTSLRSQGVDPATNSLRVGYNPEAGGPAKQILDAAAELDPTVKVVVEEAGDGRLMGRLNDAPPFFGGARTVQVGFGSCSSGIPVYDTNPAVWGRKYLVTAAHCAAPLNGTFSFTNNVQTINGNNSQTIGYINYPLFSNYGYDLALITGNIGASGLNVGRKIYTGSLGDNTTFSSILGSWPGWPNNSPLCNTGSYSYNRCPEGYNGALSVVEDDICQYSTQTGGWTCKLTGAVIGSGVAVQNGDSGGPILWKSNGYYAAGSVVSSKIYGPQVGVTFHSMARIMAAEGVALLN
jgi:Trypsin